MIIYTSNIIAIWMELLVMYISIRNVQNKLVNMHGDYLRKTALRKTVYLRNTCVILDPHDKTIYKFN